MATEHYKEALAKVCSEHFGDLNAIEWSGLVPLISEEVLQDAHECSVLYKDIMTVPGTQLNMRPCKTMKRLLKKASIVRQGQRVSFKVNSDLCAVQLVTKDIHSIKSVMQTIEANVKQAGGMFFIRNSIQDDTGTLNDIIQYAFAYIPSIGYIVEIQVGHPFAMYTFKRDSIIRDMRDANESTSNIVDLWDNNLYGLIKAKILEPAAGDTINIMSLWQSDKEPLPMELREILSSINGVY
jgi:hypothetical protein